MNDQQNEFTQLLHELQSGDRQVVDRLLPLVYEQLRKIARWQRLRWQGEETLNTTALVHEAYLRLSDGTSLDVTSRSHFLRVASKAMRYILIDHARAKKRVKRGGDQQRVPFDEALTVSEQEADELLAMDEALTRLEHINGRQSQIVECRFFGDMTIDDTAAALDLSTATVKRDWRLARAWLYREIQAE